MDSLSRSSQYDSANVAPPFYSLFCGLEGQSGYACTYRSIYEENKGPTSGLEPPTCSLRVCGLGLLSVARACNSRIDKPVTFLWLPLCCTVMRSRWCQSGVNFTSHLLGQWVPRVGSTAFFARHPRPLSPCSLQPLASPLDASVAKCRGFSDGLGLGMIPRPRCDPLWVRRGCLVHPRI